MNFSIYLVILPLASSVAWVSGRLQSLSHGSSLSVEKESDLLVSPNGTFTGGFYEVDTNAFCFSIWFTNSVNKTVVWMANRDNPVNGKRSKLALLKTGNLVLTDADGSAIWSTDASSNVDVEAQLLETGNLVVISQAKEVIWESFDYPTDTLLPLQPHTKNTTLVSMRSRGTYLSGFYNFRFDDNNVLNLIYNGPLLSSVYWPSTTWTVFQNGRTPYNSSRLAIIDEFGNFTSSDNLNFKASDYGFGPKRRLTLDYDGILRLYSLIESTGLWEISWWPSSVDACLVHGLCGVNGICTYNPQPICSCPYGYYRIDPSDWSKGCSPSFNLSCDPDELDFVELDHTDYYGYDLETYNAGITLEACRNSCISDCRCKAFGYSIDGQGQCYPKSDLRNGYQMPDNRMIMHMKVPKNLMSFISEQGNVTYDLNCSAAKELIISGGIEADKMNKSWYMKFLIGLVASVAVIEMIFVGLAWWFVFRKHIQEDLVNMGYTVLAMGFKRFTYAELKRATGNFKQEIGKGGFGTVYKGVLNDDRVVAVKTLEGIFQGEAEFWAELSIIGKINHRNLVKLWGFCAENQHKMLVYEYVENGSLDKILFSESSNRLLGWEERYNIALGTAKCLSYLHEECLEWVLHCDVKPQNILLDDHLEPKVSDFGMSKLFKDNDVRFSRVRGTRGYLAPEWTMNMKIDAKADVYSYGIVLLELISGKSASCFQMNLTQDNGCNDLVQWVTHKLREQGVKKTIDPRLSEEEYNEEKIERIVKVALMCTEEDRNRRPAMSKVVELLVEHDLS